MKRRTFLKRVGMASAALAGGPSLIQLLEACGGGTAGSPNPSATVNFSGGGEVHLLQWQSFVPEADKKMQELMTRWAGQHKGWKAALDTVNGNDLQTKVSASVQSQSGADIIQMEYNWPWLYSSACVDVGDVVARVTKQSGKFYETISSDSQVQGKWLAVPWTYVPNAWLFRKDLWTSGFPTTYDELFSAGKGISSKAGGQVGEALGHAYGDATTMWYSTLWAFGGKEVDKDGKTVAINSSETQKALEWAAEMWTNNVLLHSAISWDDSGNNRAYAAKTISATQNGASIYISTFPGHNAADPFLKTNTGASAPLKGSGGQPTIHLNFEHAVMKWSKNPGAAKDLIEYLMQKDVYGEWMTAAAGYDSFPNASMDNHPVWSQDANLKVFNDSVKFARWPGWPGPPSKQSSKVQTAFVIVDMFAKAVQNPSQIKSIISDTEKSLTATYSAPV